MIVYFSGTGTSRFCAQRLARALEDEALDAFPLLRAGGTAALGSERPWVFVAPTYGWQLPRLFRDWLRAGHLQGSRDAWFVLTCGSDIGAAGEGLQALCREKGLRFRGVLEVVMPENYIALFQTPEEPEARQIVKAALPALDAGAEWIRADQDVPPRQAGTLDRLKSGPVNALFYRFFVHDGPFRSTDACVGCGKCAERCVLGDIRMEAGRPVWSGKCTHCMACICGCPTGAIEYGRSSRGRPRYQCPEE